MSRCSIQKGVLSLPSSFFISLCFLSRPIRFLFSLLYFISGGGKGNGVPNEKFYEDLRLTDEIAALNLRLSSLKKRRRRLLREVRGKTDILADFTRQYKTDEREMIVKITEVDNSVNKLLEEKIRLQKEIEDTEKLYDAKIKEKKQQFDALCQREAEMERNFRLFSGTLKKVFTMLETTRKNRGVDLRTKSKQAENCRDVSIPSFVRLSLT
eukprot:gene62-40_t